LNTTSKQICKSYSQEARGFGIAIKAILDQARGKGDSFPWLISHFWLLVEREMSYGGGRKTLIPAARCDKICTEPRRLFSPSLPLNPIGTKIE
jgi:hypothetical protein